MFLAMTNSSFREWLPIILGNNYMKLVSRQGSLLMSPWCLMILVSRQISVLMSPWRVMMILVGRPSREKLNNYTVLEGHSLYI